MKQPISGRIAGLALFFCLHGLLQAQSDAEMARVFEWKFSMNAPDQSFSLMEGGDGWEEPATQAKVICMATPAPFEKTVADLKTIASEDGQKVLELENRTLNGVEGLIILLEFAPMEGTDTEVTYTLMFARPYDNATLLINAQYPKSEHQRLYPKMLEAFGTAKKIEN